MAQDAVARAEGVRGASPLAVAPVETVLVLSCEHGGNRVPAGFERAFASPRAQRALSTHRGYDLGALALGRALGRRLRTPLIACTVTRLLVETNRSQGHRGLFSEFAKQGLTMEQQQEALTRFYLPHRARVTAAVEAALADGKRVLHMAVHSFTPVLDGVERRAELGLLYDPSRDGEVRTSMALKSALETALPSYRVRRNYPYRGVADGLTRALRLSVPATHYAGIELEVNQRLLSNGVPATLQDALVAALRSGLSNVDPWQASVT